MHDVIQDLRYGVRSLLQNRGFALAALLCLALGIGLNTALFTLVNAVLLRPLPIPAEQRVVSVFWTNYDRGIDDGGIAFGDLADFRATGMFEQLEAVQLRAVTLTGGDQPERVSAASVTPGLLPLIGARPQFGRVFRTADAAAIGFEQAVIISHAVWQRQFGGAPDVLGRTLRVNGRELTVVGVMEPGFRFPERQDLWLPLGPTDPTDRSARALWGIGRLRDGISLAAADQRVRAAGETIRALEPANIDRVQATVITYRDAVVDATGRRAIWLMFGAVGLVLLIACANVANLLLARAADRHRELAMRVALGASRGRVMRQLLTEAAVLAAAGTALGLLLALWFTDAIVSRIPEELPYWMRFDMDRSVLLYAVAVAAGTALLFGTLPALHASRTELYDALKQGGRGGEGRAGVRLRSGLVVGEIALSLVLIVAATLVTRSFVSIMSASAGFDAERILTMRAQLVGDAYDQPLARAEFWQQAATRLRATPGLSGAAVTSAIPADDGGPTTMVRRPGEAPGAGLLAMQFASTTGYFDVLGLDLLAGRDFREEEVRDTAARVVILGRALAQRLFPEGDVIGRTIRVDPGNLEHTVIGLVPDLQYDEFGEDAIGTAHQLHVPYARFGWRGMSIIVRATGEPGAAAPIVRETLRTLDPLLVPWEVLTFAERRHYTQWERELMRSTFGSFGLLALVLALAGIYGVVSYTVARRRHELGIRLALGASPRGVVALMLRRSARLTALGLALGLAGALAAGRMLQSLLFDVQANDVRMLAGVTLALAAAALLAAWVPSRRAAGADPLEALRAE